MNGISTAITKTLYFVMAAALFLTSSMITAQVPGGSAQRADTTVLQPQVATETNDSAEIGSKTHESAGCNDQRPSAKLV